MWLTKWLLVAAVMQENVWPYVSDHISERLDGNIGIGLGRYLFGALTKNIGCLFPFDYGIVGGIAFCVQEAKDFMEKHQIKGGCLSWIMDRRMGQLHLQNDRGKND